MKTITVGQLKKGDIFKFGPNCWDSVNRHENTVFYNDRLEKWQDEWNKDCRICFWLTSPYGNGKFKGMFKWSDTNSLDQIVYIPEYGTSNWKRLKGQYVWIMSNQHYPFHFPLNDINKELTNNSN